MNELDDLELDDIVDESNDNVSISRIRSYSQCEVKAFVFDSRRLGYQGTTNDAMLLGSYVHALLEEMHTVGELVTKLSDAGEAYSKVVHANMQDAAIIAKAFNIVQQYVRFINRTTHPFKNMKVVEIERKFEFDGFSGIIDLLLVNDEGHYFVCDFKTSKNVTTFETSIKYDEQLQLYSIASPFNIKGVFFVVLKAREALASNSILPSGKISTNKTNNTSYELFTELLDSEGIPRDKYSEYLHYLLTDGANNVIAYHEYEAPMLIKTLDRLEKAKKRIQSLQYIQQCMPNISYNCAMCPVVNQCIQIQNDVEPNFMHLEKPEKGTVSFNITTKKKVKTADEINEELFG